MKNLLPSPHKMRLQIPLYWISWLLLAFILLLASSVAYAQTGGGYSLTWWTVDTGGRTGAFGGSYILHSTTGQPEADPAAATGGGYTLLSGFWPSSVADSGGGDVYLPLIVKDFVSAPDLVVDSLVATGGATTVTIHNVGNAPVVDAFWVDVYLNPTTAPTHVNQGWQDLGPQGLVWGVQGAALPLDPGESLTLTLGDAYYSAEGSHFNPPLPAGSPVYAQVDSVNLLTSYGGVLESHEISGGPYNNIRQAVSTAGVNPATGGGEVSPFSAVGLPPR